MCSSREESPKTMKFWGAVSRVPLGESSRGMWSTVTPVTTTLSRNCTERISNSSEHHITGSRKAWGRGYHYGTRYCTLTVAYPDCPSMAQHSPGYRDGYMWKFHKYACGATCNNMQQHACGNNMQHACICANNMMQKHAITCMWKQHAYCM